MCSLLEVYVMPKLRLGFNVDPIFISNQISTLGFDVKPIFVSNQNSTSVLCWRLMSVHCWCQRLSDVKLSSNARWVCCILVCVLLPICLAWCFGSFWDDLKKYIILTILSKLMKKWCGPCQIFQNFLVRCNSETLGHEICAQMFSQTYD